MQTQAIEALCEASALSSDCCNLLFTERQLPSTKWNCLLTEWQPNTEKKVSYGVLPSSSGVFLENMQHYQVDVNIHFTVTDVTRETESKSLQILCTFNILLN